MGASERANAENRIVLTTYHSSKGLDFDAVALPSIQTDLGEADNENAIILVALSRAKRDLLITFTGSMYSGFKRFLLNTTVREINNLESDNDEVVF